MIPKELAKERSSQTAFPDNNIPPEDIDNPKYQGLTVLEYFTAETMKLIAASPGGDIRTPSRQREIAEAAADMALIVLIAVKRKAKQLANGVED